MGMSFTVVAVAGADARDVAARIGWGLGDAEVAFDGGAA